MSSGWPPNSYPHEYPTIINTPQPPKKKGMPLWGILLLSIGVPALVCSLCTALVLLAPKLPKASVEATDTIAPTASVVLPAPDHIQIGASVQGSEGKYQIIGAKTNFRGSDSFAWAFTSDTQITSDQTYGWVFGEPTHHEFANGELLDISQPTYQLSKSYSRLSTYLPNTPGVDCIFVYHVLTQVGQACFSYTP